MELKLHLNQVFFIVSDVSIDKINHVYVSCIQESVERLRHAFHQQLHSVYVYGSVARGDAIAPKSDLDLIAMFDGKLSSIELDKLKQLAGELSKQYRALCRDVGIAVAYYRFSE